MSYYYPQAGVVLKITWETFDGGPVDTARTVLRVVPLEVAVEINSYLEADTFTCTLDYKTFPFDPRTIRSVWVSVHMQDAKQLTQFLNTQNPQLTNTDNIVFAGFVDEGSIKFGDDGRTVTFDGRDYTSFFIDRRRLRPDGVFEGVNLAAPIDKVFQRLINEIPGAKIKTSSVGGNVFSGIRVVNRTGKALPNLARVGAGVTKKDSTKNPKHGENYWEIIQSIANRAGVIAYIDLDQLIISNPQNLYAENRRTQLVYGNNISNLTFKRRIGRQKALNIKVYSTQIEGKKPLSVVLPKDAKSKEFINRFGNNPIYVEQYDSNGEKLPEPKLAETISFRVPDVSDAKSLTEIGESIFEEISRQHLEGSLSTNEMLFNEFVGDTPTQVPFSNIRVGTSLEIILHGQDIAKITTQSSVVERKSYLLSRGYPEEVAGLFAKSLTKVKYVFYTQAVSYKFSTDGFAMDIDFINIIDLGNRSLGGSMRKDR